MATGQRAKAEELRRLHMAAELLVLVNVWDVASARVVAGTPGCRAIATASWSIAAALGYRDGEQIPREEMIAAVGRIASAVDQPVTADLEAGFGASAAEVGETMSAAIEAGAVGCNLEDGVSGDVPLRPLGEAAERVAAAREAGERADVPLVINARTDVFLARVGSAEEQEEVALERGRAYLAAGRRLRVRARPGRPGDDRAAGGRAAARERAGRRARAGARRPAAHRRRARELRSRPDGRRAGGAARGRRDAALGRGAARRRWAGVRKTANRCGHP